MKRDERVIQSFELVVSTSKQAASPPTLRAVMERIQEAYDSEEAFMLLNKGTASIEISDYKEDSVRRIVTMLIKYIDYNGSDVSFTDHISRSSRIERKGATEGRDFGAHVCISIDECQGRANIYSALIERVPGVSSSFIMRLMQFILRELYKRDSSVFRSDDISGARRRDGGPKQIQFRPMLEFQGLPSDEFIADLEAGAIKEVYLIEDKQGAQFGAQPWLTEDQRVLRLKPGPAGPARGNVWGALTRMLANEAKQAGFERARIRFKRADGEGDTVDLDAATGGLLDHRYVKALRIEGINPPLGECPGAIVDHFAELIREQLVEARNP